MNRREFLGAIATAPIAIRGAAALGAAPFPSLGRAGGDVTTAQHCRAEVWADGYGWIPGEMNWIAFNDAHDVALPASTGKPLPFLMYPQAEVGGDRLDSLDPAKFKCTITARQL